MLLKTAGYVYRTPFWFVTVEGVGVIAKVLARFLV